MSSKRELGVIKLVTLSDCDYCIWLKSELDEQGITYTDINAYNYPKLADEIENKFKTESYPIVFIDLNVKTITIVPETKLETSDTLHTFDTIPQLVGIIKQYIK
jgi:glutaredoxin